MSVVTSFNTRVGAVVSAVGDYLASQVNNDSTVVGTRVSDALNTLAAAIAAIPAAPVSSVFGRVGAVAAAVGDYLASQVNNDSTVVGTRVSDALNTLKAAIAAIPSAPVSSVFARTGAVVAAAGDYTSTLVNNASGVTGTTVTAALNTLLALLGAPTLNNQTGTTYAPVLADAGKLVTLSNAASIAVLIPANASVAFPVGTIIDFLWLGVGQPTFTITSDTLNIPAAFAVAAGTMRAREQFSPVRITKVTSTSWVASGDMAFV